MNNFADQLNNTINKVITALGHIQSGNIGAPPTPHFFPGQLNSALGRAKQMHQSVQQPVQSAPVLDKKITAQHKSGMMGIKNMEGPIMDDQGMLVGGTEEGKTTMYKTPQPALDSFHRKLLGVSEDFNNLPGGEQWNKNAWDAHHSLNGNRFQYISPQGMHQIMTDPNIPKPKAGINVGFNVPQGATIHNAAPNIYTNTNRFNDIIDKLFSNI